MLEKKKKKNEGPRGKEEQKKSNRDERMETTNRWTEREDKKDWRVRFVAPSINFECTRRRN